MSDSSSIIIVDQFFSQAQALRDEYLNRFAQPLRADQERFVWDYWHVPDQYTLMRTSAESFFSEELYSTWLEAMSQWGFENLGCSEISPPWLSYYVDGCEQQLHADNPHGPWAFVFSLTDWAARRFRGGETQLLNPKVLDYWREFDSSVGFEKETLFETIEPHLNRLLVFDPRVPHGVAPVWGEKDPRGARLVIHGWFLEPTPTMEGGLEGVDVQEELAEVLNPVLDSIEEDVTLNGYLAVRLEISTSGAVSHVRLLQNTLRLTSAGEFDIQYIEQTITRALSQAQFPVAAPKSRLTLPLIFR